MPYFDFNRSTDVTAFGQPEFVIVGAGAAGIFLAVTLVERGRTVLLIESGHFDPDEERQALNAIEETGKRQGNPLWNRKRIIGGTTTAWGGQSLPFSPIDFETRPGSDSPGWPIPFGELAPHYARANAFMNVDPWNYDTDIAARLGRPAPEFDPRLVRCHFSKWAPQPNFRRLHARRLAASVPVLYNAQLVGLNLRDATAVRSIVLANFTGGRAELPVRTLLLATGGIEASRTLLLNTQRDRGGLGDHAGWLGRGFMDHPTMQAGTVTPKDGRLVQRHFALQWRRPWKYSVRMSAAEAWLRDQRMLNISGSLMFTHASPEDDWLWHAKETFRRPHPRRLAGLWRQRGAALAGLSALLTERFVYRPGAPVTFVVMTEQEPSAGSRVALSTETDRFNLPKARLHWQISPRTWRTVVAFSRVVQGELARLGLGELVLHPHLRDDEPDWARHLGDVNHHMGGTRMSARPEEGVVDPGLRPWGMTNLRVCSASVFPSGSHSNPTLTLLALCSRVADELSAPTGVAQR